MATAIARPNDPIAAVTHPDPYPYYAALVARTPLYRDDALGLWVASSAAAVTAVLTSGLCRVRPPGEPVPAALIGSPAAQIFRRLIRMNDGEGHGPLKGALSATMASIRGDRITAIAKTCAESLWKESGPPTDLRRVDDFAFELPARVVGSLLGVPDEKLHQTAVWIGDFVRCLAPASTAEQLERGASQPVVSSRWLARFSRRKGSSASWRAKRNGLIATISTPSSPMRSD